MVRRVHIAMLSNAARLVPGPQRADWLAEWTAELCYVDRGATAFCLGSFRDALWIRRAKLAPTRWTLNMKSPFQCVLLLGIITAASSFAAFGLPSRDSFAALAAPSAWGNFATGCFWMYLEALLTLAALGPLRLGEHGASWHAPTIGMWLRRWIFLAMKFALVPPIAFFTAIALVPIFPPAGCVGLFSLILGLRWTVEDQRRRCPVCLHLLSHPTQIGSPAQLMLGRYGTELICTRGHGALYVPEIPTSWCGAPCWRSFDSTWSGLRSQGISRASR